jgi:hypothetical protein
VSTKFRVSVVVEARDEDDALNVAADLVVYAVDAASFRGQGGTIAEEQAS